MRKYREIIKTSTGLKLSDLIVESENSDPLLCSKCQIHGYCTAKFYKQPETNELIPIPNSESIGKNLFKLKNIAPITDREISNLVNVKTDIKEATTKFGKKLQKAHDLFHQDEFEQASYMYLDIIETRNDITEAWRGICASFYFLGKYEEAVSACLISNINLEDSFINRFVKRCEKTVKTNGKIIDSNAYEIKSSKKKNIYI